MSVDAVRAAAAAASSPAARALPAAGQGDFSAALQRQLEAPRAEIAGIRAEIAALRGGGALARAATSMADVTMPTEATVTLAWLDTALSQQATGDDADPYGWRALSRATAERVIGPGSGALFERQIQQESAFDPAIVYGMRVSSAGAEGIAQLMPQYYGHVDRRDPAASLAAGAQSMREYLAAWDGDVAKALASYNAGPGRVQEAVAARGAGWESALPAETQHYLSAILGAVRPRYLPT